MSNDPFDPGPPPEDQGSTDFFDGGEPSCRFNEVGAMHQGTILDFKEAQQRDIKTKAPKTWPDGNPCMMLVITLQTDERDSEIDDDDGKRKLYVNKPGGMFAAIIAAKGKHRFMVGGHLAIKYVGNGKPKQAGFNPPKNYAAKYFPPGVMQAATSQPASNQNDPATGMDDLRLAAKAEAWAKYKVAFPGDPVAMSHGFKNLFANYFQGANPDTVTLPQWRAFIKNDFKRKAEPEPTFDEPSFNPDDLPV